VWVASTIKHYANSHYLVSIHDIAEKIHTSHLILFSQHLSTFLLYYYSFSIDVANNLDLFVNVFILIGWSNYRSIKTVVYTTGMCTIVFCYWQLKYVVFCIMRSLDSICWVVFFFSTHFCTRSFAVVARTIWYAFLWAFAVFLLYAFIMPTRDFFRPSYPLPHPLSLSFGGCIVQIDLLSKAAVVEFDRSVYIVGFRWYCRHCRVLGWVPSAPTRRSMCVLQCLLLSAAFRNST